jgi:uncharacterized protein YciI
MLFFVQCVDKPNATQLRQQTRPAHLEYLKPFTAQIRIAGPTLAADQATPTGSVFIIDLPDRAAVEKFCADDPYAKAGLFERTTIQSFRKVIPA